MSVDAVQLWAQPLSQCNASSVHMLDIKSCIEQHASALPPHYDLLPGCYLSPSCMLLAEEGVDGGRGRGGGGGA